MKEEEKYEYVIELIVRNRNSIPILSHKVKLRSIEVGLRLGLSSWFITRLSFTEGT